MSDYADKLLSLAEKKQKLLAEEVKLIEKRKAEIGSLAEKLDLLTVSDEFLAGLFSDAKNAIEKKTDRVREWENLGGRFLKPRTTKAKRHTETA